MEQAATTGEFRDTADDMYCRFYHKTARVDGQTEVTLTLTLPLSDPKVLIRSGARHDLRVRDSDILTQRTRHFMDVLRRHGLENDFIIFGGHGRNMFSGREGVLADLDIVAAIPASTLDLLRVDYETYAQFAHGELTAEDQRILREADLATIREHVTALEAYLGSVKSDNEAYARIESVYQRRYADKEPFQGTALQIRNSTRFSSYLEKERRYVLPAVNRLETALGLKQGDIADYLAQNGIIVQDPERVKNNVFEGSCIDYAGYVTTDGVYFHAEGRFEMGTYNFLRMDGVGVWGNGSIFDPYGALDDYRNRTLRLQYPVADQTKEVNIRRALRCIRIKQLSLCRPDDDATTLMHDYVANKSGLFSSAAYWQQLVARRATLDAAISRLEALVLHRRELQRQRKVAEVKQAAKDIDAHIESIISIFANMPKTQLAARIYLKSQYEGQLSVVERRRKKGLDLHEAQRDLDTGLENHLYLPYGAGALISDTKLNNYVIDRERDPYFVAWFVGKIYRAAFRPQDVITDLAQDGLLPIMRALSIDVDGMERDAIQKLREALDLRVSTEEVAALTAHLAKKDPKKTEWSEQLLLARDCQIEQALEEGRYISARSLVEQVLSEQSETAVALNSAEALAAREPTLTSQVCADSFARFDSRQTPLSKDEVFCILGLAFEELSLLESTSGDYELCDFYHRRATHYFDAIPQTLLMSVMKAERARVESI
ncbi:MAG: hypothetical protein WCG78_00290 [Candidatus Omnitrophota bacterium]